MRSASLEHVVSGMGAGWVVYSVGRGPGRRVAGGGEACWYPAAVVFPPRWPLHDDGRVLLYCTVFQTRGDRGR